MLIIFKVLIQTFFWSVLFFFFFLIYISENCSCNPIGSYLHLKIDTPLSRKWSLVPSCFCVLRCSWYKSRPELIIWKCQRGRSHRVIWLELFSRRGWWNADMVALALHWWTWWSKNTIWRTWWSKNTIWWTWWSRNTIWWARWPQVTARFLETDIKWHYVTACVVTIKTRYILKFVHSKPCKNESKTTIQLPKSFTRSTPPPLSLYTPDTRPHSVYC